LILAPLAPGTFTLPDELLAPPEPRSSAALFDIGVHGR
jgi:hypothetical protein